MYSTTHKLKRFLLVFTLIWTGSHATPKGVSHFSYSVVRLCKGGRVVSSVVGVDSYTANLGELFPPGGN